jgi:hypothetical protein
MANIIAQASAPSWFSVLPSAARTATPVDTNEYELGGRARALTVVIDVTAVTSTPSTTFTILGVDRISGKTWTILASAAIATVSTTVLRIAPGITATANVSANDVVPPIVRIVASHGNGNSMTYSVAGYVSS